MTEDEVSADEARRILIDAGWLPHPEYGVYTRGTLVMGITPDRLTLHVKDHAFIQPGDPRYGPDTPDTPEEAAQWLVDLCRALPPLADESAPNIEVEFVGEAEENPADDGPSEELGLAAVEHALGAASSVAGGGDFEAALAADQLGEGDRGVVEHVTDAEFDEAAYLDLAPAELPELEAPDLGAEIADAEAEAPSGAFIFGDNLDQKRTAAIGLVTRIALDRTPPWAADENARLMELRNFVMGVSEDRWADDPDKREELDTLESTLRAINAITAARDAKVSFLVTATHADLDVFDPESDWP